jgi:hypothetical protein
MITTPERCKVVFEEIQIQRQAQVDHVKATYKVKVAQPHWKDSFVTCLELQATEQEIIDSLIFFHGTNPIVEKIPEFDNFFNVTSSGYLN